MMTQFEPGYRLGRAEPITMRIEIGNELDADMLSCSIVAAPPSD